MEENVWIAALTGLLHDIGKFALRAGESSTRTWDQEAKRDFGYKHVLLTDDFVAKYVPTVWKGIVRQAAVGQHRPSHPMDYAISLGDHLSAGERTTPESDEAVAKTQQLISICCSIEADGQRAPSWAYWPLSELKLEDTVVFPITQLPAEQITKRYASLWQAFVSAVSRLGEAHSASASNLDLYLENLLMILQRYTWCIPSTYYQSRPDVSLYDHARVTAALAATLISSGTSDASMQQILADTKATTEPIALLVGGDLSGVQSFLYTISARGATSSLRGRSFYLQLLTEAAARYTLSRLGLPITNLLYCGGGNFYLLARPGDTTKLREIQTEIGRLLFSAHRGDLSLGLGNVPLIEQDFFDGRISQRWAALTEAMQTSKLRKFSSLGDDLAAVFEPEGHGGNEEQFCAVCGAEDSKIKIEERDNGEKVRKCRACASYEDLGDTLRSSQYLTITLLSPKLMGQIKTTEPTPYQEVLQALGMEISLSEGMPQPEPGKRRIIYALSDQAMMGLDPGPDQAVGRKLLVNVTPVFTPSESGQQKIGANAAYDHPGSIKPFDELEAQSTGVKRLGILRMDVDNLGQMFSHGLGKDATISRVASLSFAISLYFEGWVEVLGERINRETGNRLYSIYAGGDDLFFAGSWDAIVELSRRIRADLSRFACNHPGIHASGGIVLVGGKYPLAQAANDALQAESAAKSFRRADGRMKDAIHFLGQTISWERFGLEPDDEEGNTTVHNLMRYLANRENIHQLLQRLIQFQEMYQDAVKKRGEAGRDQTRTGQTQVLYGPWNWLSEYSLKRLERQTKDTDVMQLRQKLKEDNFQSIEWIGLAARWAELLTRKGEGNERH